MSKSRRLLLLLLLLLITLLMLKVTLQLGTNIRHRGTRLDARAHFTYHEIYASGSDSACHTGGFYV